LSATFLAKHKVGADFCLFFWLIQVTGADYLNGRMTVHFPAHDGFVRCISRLLVADFVPSLTSVVDAADLSKSDFFEFFCFFMLTVGSNNIVY
jgi:hypothetical protein